MTPITRRQTATTLRLALIGATCLLAPLPVHSQQFAGPLAYVPLGDTDAVAVITLPALTVLTLGNTVLQPPRQGSGPTEVAATGFGPVAYAANRDAVAGASDPFAVVSPLFGGQIPVGTGQFGIKLGPVGSPVAGLLFAVNSSANVTETIGGTPTTVSGYAISVIATGLVAPNAPVSYAVVSAIPTDVSPAELAFTSDGAILYVTHTGSNHVWAVNPAIGAQIASINVGNRTQGVAVVPFSAPAINPAIVPSAYVTMPTANAVGVIDIALQTLVGMIPVGRNPLAIVVNATGTTAWVTNSGDGTVSVINTATNAVTGVIPVGLNPSSIAYDVATNELVVLNSGSKNVSIINAATSAVLATIPVALNNAPPPPAASGAQPLASAGGASSGSGGIAIGSNGDGGAEPVLYTSHFDGSVSAVGLYTLQYQPSKSLAASRFAGPALPAGTLRQITWDPFGKLVWYSTVNGTADQIRSVDPATGNPGPVIVNALPGTPVGFRRQVFIDYGSQRLGTVNNDYSVSFFDLATGAAHGSIAASFFNDGWTGFGYVRCFASDPRTGNLWTAFADGSFREIALLPAVSYTGRKIPVANQVGAPLSVFRNFGIDPKTNALVYETNVTGGGTAGEGYAAYTLAAVSLSTLTLSGQFWGSSYYLPTPFTPISIGGADQCQLSTSANPPSAGWVTVSPAGNGGGFFDCGSQATVRGMPKPGNQFSTFSGDLTGSENGQIITLEGSQSVIADFATAGAISVSVSPSSVTLQPGATQQFTAMVNNASTPAVTWSVVSGGGTISAGGLYTAPAQATDGQSATIQATSRADGTTFGAASIQFSTAGIPAHMTVVSGANQTVATGAALAPFVALVTDSHNNPVAGAGVIWEAGLVGGAAGCAFAGGSTAATSVSDAHGDATSPVCTVGANAGAFNVTALISGALFVNFPVIIVTPVPVSFQTVPPGLLISVDNQTAQTTPFTVNLLPGSHTISAPMTQPAPGGGQAVFAGWDVGGNATQTVNITGPTGFTAFYKLPLTALVSPTGGGTATPTFGIYDANSTVPITAAPASGFVFAGWTGGTAGAIADPTSKTTTVTMAAAEIVTAVFTPIVITLSGSSTQADPSGGTGSFGVSITPATQSWEAGTTNSWIHITSGATGSGTGTVGFSVDMNQSPTSRTGTITVSSGGATHTYTITQGGTLPTLAITKTRDPGTFLAGTGQNYTITVRNTGSVPTAGTLTVTDVVPPGMTTILTVSPGWTCSIPNQTVTCISTTPIPPGGSSTITIGVLVTSDPAFWNGSSNIFPTNTATVQGGGTASGQSAISPKAHIAYVDVTPSSPLNGDHVVLDQGAQTATFQVNTGSQVQWSATTNDLGVSGFWGFFLGSSPGWLTITSGGSGDGPGTVTYQVSANTDANGRDAIIWILGSDGSLQYRLKIHQAGNPVCPPITATPSKFEFDKNGGKGLVTIGGVGPTCGWFANTTSDWISLAHPVGDGSSVDQGTGPNLNFSVAPDTGAARTGTITIYGHTIQGQPNTVTVTVTQTGAQCSYNVTPSSGSSPMFASSGGASSAAVTTQPGCQWMASGTGPVTVTPSIGTGPGTIQFGAAANPSASTPLTGAINVQGVIVPVTVAPTSAPEVLCGVAAAQRTARKEGTSELLGDMVLVCTNTGSTAVTGTVSLSLNTNLTNGLLPSTGPSGQTTDALLIIGNPPQNLVLGTSAFLGTAAGPATVQFTNVTLPPGTTTLRITNVRGNASAAPAQGIVGTASLTFSVPATITNAQQTLAIVQAADPSVGALTPIPGTTQSTASVTFTPGFPNAFVPRILPGQDSGTLGTVYPSETGFVNSALFGNQVGFASFGTRPAVNVSNIPDGVAAYASVWDTNALARLYSADINGLGGFPAADTAQFGTSPTAYFPLNIVNGSTTATWEVMSPLGSATQLTFGLVIDNPGNVDLSGMQFSTALAPQTTSAAPSASLPVPRFTVLSPTGPWTPLSSTNLNLGMLPPATGQGNVRPTAEALAAAPTTTGTTGTTGTTVTITEQLTNDSSTPAPNVVVNGSLPSGWVVTGCTAADNGGACHLLQNSNTFQVTYPSLAAGGLAVITIQAQSATAATGTPVAFNSYVVSDAANLSLTTGALSTVLTATALATPVTIQTSPTGLQFTVDGGVVQMAPQTLNLSQGSHTIAVTSPQAGPAGTQYVFTGWSDGLGASHSINVGTAAATYTATFKTQYQLTISASPAAGGTVTPASGGYYDSGSTVSIAATANTSYTFNGWTGTVASANSASTSVTMSAAETVVANFSSVTGVTIQTSPPGLQFTVDGGAAQTAPQMLNLSQGSHTIAVTSPQAGAAGTQYVFTSWSDNGAASHSITVGTTAATYTATFKTQYQLTISASPAAGGTVTPNSGGFYDSASVVNIAATASGAYLFTGWTGSVANAASASTTVTMSAAETVAATFAITTFTLSATSANVAASGGTGSVTVTASVATATWTAVSNATSFLTITAGASGTGNGTVSYSVAANNTFSSRMGTLTIAGLTFTVTQAGIATNGLGFYPVTPCRVMDTRTGQGKTGAYGPPSLTARSSRNIAIPGSGCNIPATAQAYSLNVTVAPPAALNYLTIWPTGQTQPVVSTLNSLSGAIVANAAIVPAGTNQSVSVYVSDATDAIIDINGYFAPPSGAALAFYPATPCRVADTRAGQGFTGQFGPPSMTAGQTRNFAIPASACNIPATAQAYSLNMTVAPPGPLTYLSAWPTGQTQPVVSTLNSLDGRVAANAAIVPAGTNGAVSLYTSNASDVIVDINGYFAPPGAPGALYFYAATPCRVVDTRAGQGFTGPYGPPSLGANSTRTFAMNGACGLPSSAQAFSLNFTVVPPGPLTYLTTWPSGVAQPVVSTLNSLGGQVVANAALVPGTNGSISVFVSNATDLIVDVNGWFGQ